MTGSETDENCNVSFLKNVYLDKGSKWREAWRVGEAKPQALGAMAFSRRDLWRQISNLYKILYIRAYVLYCYLIS